MCKRDYGLLFEQLRGDYRDKDREWEHMRNYIRASLPFIRRDYPEAEGMIRWANELLAEAEAGEQRRAPRWNGATFKAGS